MADGIAGDNKIIANANSSADIEYRRIRAPREHGQILQIPSLNQVDDLWHTNRAIDFSNSFIGQENLASLRQLARQEVVDLAVRYSQQYLDVDTHNLKTESIVMAGHQPELFHPGVWYKNFVLSTLGQRFNSTAINLVVDNDICGNASIRFPQPLEPSSSQSKITVGTIPIAKPGDNVPHESREIEDWDFFVAFADRIGNALAKTSEPRIIDQLWPEVVTAATRVSGSRQPRLGEALAAGRHRLEQKFGLCTLEVPISWVASTKSFATFAKTIFSDIERFQDTYNQTLHQYRTVHRIRSRSHPVPELTTNGQWREVPFWIWRTDAPHRRGLFVSQQTGQILLSNLSDWEIQIPLDRFEEQFCNLSQQGIAIRPRALMTTLFSRMLLSDLFLHGIGGAKYDQLTDAIAEKFLSTKLPAYVTLSATMKLPSDSQIVRREDLIRLKQLARELKYHPESHIARPNETTQTLIDQKRALTSKHRQTDRSHEKHVAINGLNEQLQRLTDLKRDDVLNDRDGMKERLRESQILDSREYSFCLFPESLPEELFEMARI